MAIPQLDVARLKLAKAAVVTFVPYCVLPATLVTIASIIFIIGNVSTLAQFSRSIVNLSDLLSASIVFLASITVGMVLLLAGLSRWIFVLLAFCRFWLEILSEEGQVNDLANLKQQAITEIIKRKASLAKFWLLLLAVLLLPMMLFCSALGLKLISLVGLFGAQAVILPRSVDFILLPIAIILAVGLTIVSLIAMPVAAMSTDNAGQAVKQTFVVCLKKFPQALLLSLLVMIVNTAVASPQLLSNWASFESYLLPSTNIVLAVFAQIWQGLVSVILFPISLIPFCELIRDTIPTDN
jgi:hypothetical protein